MPIEQSIEQLRRTEAAFLNTDLDLAETFLNRAASTQDEAVVTRCLRNADTVYRTVERLTAAAKLSAGDSTRVAQRLCALRARLKSLSLRPK